MTRSLLWPVTIALIVLALLWGCYWLFYLRFHESTDDAYVNSSLISINSIVTGSVEAFYADDTDFVQEGQLLIQLDKTAFQIAYEKELATLASVVLQVKQLYDTVLAREANVENKQVALQRARYDFDNRLHLVNTKAISHEEFSHAQDSYKIAEFDLKQAEKELQMARDAIGNTSYPQHPLIEQQRGAVRSAYYELQHCAIYAPQTGYVAKRSVNVGQSVTPTANLMAVIPAAGFWVDANFKETQLKKMRIGQPATIWLDLYGSKVRYDGKVLGISSGTGSVFSLIPPQNATGNWIKIVQRLPVRILLDPKTLKSYPARLGLSAEVTVNLHNQDLPYLSKVPSQQVVKTPIFKIDMEQVEQAMEAIVNG